MPEIVNFKKKWNPEDEFLESLSEYQLELFNEVLNEIIRDFMAMQDKVDKMEAAFARKCAENEVLKLKLMEKGETK